MRPERSDFSGRDGSRASWGKTYMSQLCRPAAGHIFTQRCRRLATCARKAAKGAERRRAAGCSLWVRLQPNLNGRLKPDPHSCSEPKRPAEAGPTRQIDALPNRYRPRMLCRARIIAAWVSVSVRPRVPVPAARQSEPPCEWRGRLDSVRRIRSRFPARVRRPPGAWSGSSG